MKTLTLRGALIATTVLALTIGACVKKPKDDKAKDGDKMAAAMTVDAMKPEAMKPEAMTPEAMTPAVKPAMTAEAMQPAGTAPAGDSYTIKFDRPLKPGLKYRLVVGGTESSRTTLNGKPLPAQTFKLKFRLEAEVTVKAVHTSGKATQEELKIVRFEGDRNGKALTLLPKDTVVVATVEGDKEKFTVKGKPVAKPAAKLLGNVVSLYQGDSTTTDDVFGPGGPKKVGDSWKPNAEKMLTSLKLKMKDMALWPKVSDVTGKVTFVGAKKAAGMDVLQIDAHAKLNNFAPKMGPVKATAGHMEMRISGWLPKDPKVTIDEAKTMMMRLHVEGEIAKGGQNLKVVIDYMKTQRDRKSEIK